MDKKNFNREIKKIRIKKGLSQKELANLSNLSLRTIQRIENGETNPIGDTKRKIISTLEPYPDLDFSDTDNNIDQKNFLQKMVMKWEYLLITYIFSLLAALIGLFAGMWIFFNTGLIIGFLCLISFSISLVYNVKNKGWKESLKYFIITVSAIVIYLFPIAYFILMKLKMV